MLQKKPEVVAPVATTVEKSSTDRNTAPRKHRNEKKKEEVDGAVTEVAVAVSSVDLSASKTETVNDDHQFKSAEKKKQRNQVSRTETGVPIKLESGDARNSKQNKKNATQTAPLVTASTTSTTNQVRTVFMLILICGSSVMYEYICYS